MNIPDGMVWTSVPTMAAIGGWALRQFVLSVKAPTPDPPPAIAAAPPAASPNPPAAPGHNPEDMSVRDYRILSKLLIEDFNGRYMPATELRGLLANIMQRLDRGGERFDNIEEKVSGIEQRLAGIHPRKEAHP